MKRFKKTLAAAAVASAVSMAAASAHAIGLDSIDNMLHQTAVSGWTDIDLSQSLNGNTTTIDNLKISAGNYLDNDGVITATVDITGGSITSGLTEFPSSVTMTANANASGTEAISSATAVASTANLASSIAATAVGAMNTGNVTVETAMLTSTLTDGATTSSIAQIVPMINAHNLVSNEADITASVNLTASSLLGGNGSAGTIALGLTNVTATALGAVNTGSITVRAGVPSPAM